MCADVPDGFSYTSSQFEAIRACFESFHVLLNLDEWRKRLQTHIQEYLKSIEVERPEPASRKKAQMERLLTAAKRLEVVLKEQYGDGGFVKIDRSTIEKRVEQIFQQYNLGGDISTKERQERSRPLFEGPDIFQAIHGVTFLRHWAEIELQDLDQIDPPKSEPSSSAWMSKKRDVGLLAYWTILSRLGWEYSFVSGRRSHLTNRPAKAENAFLEFLVACLGPASIDRTDRALCQFWQRYKPQPTLFNFLEFVHPVIADTSD